MAQSRLKGDEEKKKTSKPVDKSKIQVPGTQQDTIDTSKLTPEQKKKYETAMWQREMRAVDKDTTLSKYGKSAAAGNINIKYKKKYSSTVPVQEEVDAQRKAEKEGKSSGTIYYKSKK